MSMAGPAGLGCFAKRCASTTASMPRTCLATIFTSRCPIIGRWGECPREPSSRANVRLLGNPAPPVSRRGRLKPSRWWSSRDLGLEWTTPGIGPDGTCGFTSKAVRSFRGHSPRRLPENHGAVRRLVAVLFLQFLQETFRGKMFARTAGVNRIDLLVRFDGVGAQAAAGE